MAQVLVPRPYPICFPGNISFTPFEDPIEASCARERAGRAAEGSPGGVGEKPPFTPRDDTLTPRPQLDQR